MNLENKKLNRRTLVGGGTVAAGLAIATNACTPMTNQQQQTGIDKGKEAELMNALLTAEYKAIDAYTQGAAVLTNEKDNGATQAAKDLAALVLAVAVEFQKDHRAHAVVLAKAVTDLGGTPVNESDSKFTLPTGFKASTVNVMKLAANEERRAAIAYNGVIKTLQTTDNRYIGASIQGDESQHFIVLAALIEGLAKTTSSIVADQVVPRAFVASTTDFGGEAGLEAEIDISTTDMG